MAISISRLNKEDISQLSHFFKRNVINVVYYSKAAKEGEAKRFNEKNLTHRFANKDNLCLIAKEEERIIGMCNGYYDAGLFWIDWLLVDKNYRNRGYGEKLIRAIEKIVFKNKVHKIWFDTRTNNKPSIGLVKKLGYKKIANVEKHWYGHDFILRYKLF